jgi:sec-independent protein translocase protein TatA
MFNIGPLELMVILVIALLVVGPSRLPEVGRSIGRGIREFRKAQEEVQKTIQSALNDEPVAPSSPPSSAPSELASDAAALPEGQATTDGTDVARHVGKGLAELRRARDEIQRSLRVDIDDEGDGGRSKAE